MSTVKSTNLSDLSGNSVPINTVVNGSAKAWVNFNGTGTVAIRKAFNVSSITDSGTGAYGINFTTAMPDSNYSISCSTSFQTTVSDIILVNINTDSGSTPTANSFRVRTKVATGNVQDIETLGFSIFD